MEGSDRVEIIELNKSGLIVNIRRRRPNDAEEVS